MLNIAVCIKQILDPEIPAKTFSIDAETMRAIPPAGAEFVISDFDERAIEAALRVKDSCETNITVISLGPESAKNAIRRCIAMGADRGLLLSDTRFDDADSYATAFILAKAIQKMGGFDIILCGRQEGDWDAGQVGSGIAELLHIPSVTMIGKIMVSDSKAVVERVVSDGRETVEIPLPALFTVGSEIGEPRYPPIRKVMQAAKVEIPTWTAEDTGVAQSKNRMLSISVPPRDVRCKFIEGKDAEEAGINLALRLREDKII